MLFFWHTHRAVQFSQTEESFKCSQGWDNRGNQRTWSTSSNLIAIPADGPWDSPGVASIRRFKTQDYCWFSLSSSHCKLEPCRTFIGSEIEVVRASLAYLMRLLRLRKKLYVRRLNNLFRALDKRRRGLHWSNSIGSRTNSRTAIPRTMPPEQPARTIGYR